MSEIDPATLTPEELRRAIAENMGWRDIQMWPNAQCGELMGRDPEKPKDHPEFDPLKTIPNWQLDIADAWELVLKMPNPWIFRDGDNWYCRPDHIYPPEGFAHGGEPHPDCLCICRASLAMEMSEEEKPCH